MVFNVLFGQMEKVEELLPGIEDFLCKTLAYENLSDIAEQQRLYFVERLDILQLPPTVPPRRSAPKLDLESNLPPKSPERLQTSPERDIKSPTSSTLEDTEDFVAYQRELSRSLLSGANSEEELKEKLYDDIDHQQNSRIITEAEINFYEIPVPKGSESPQKENDYEETTISSSGIDKEKEEQSCSSAVPPPLPPRRDRTASDAQSRSSCGSILDDVKPNLPLRPQLTPKSELCRGSNEHLVDIVGDEFDRTSYESHEDECGKFSVQLPKQIKKSSKHKKLSKSRSSKEWDLNVPFKSLEEVTLSGELQYKGKLSWTRKMCALSEGRLVCYKPDKCDSKPAIVIQLTGYTSSFVEKDNHKGYDIRLVHPTLELHTFSTDFKDWATMWCEYMNSMCEGQPPPGQYHHLARSSTFSGLDSSQIYGSKADVRMSNSQASLASSDGLDQDFIRSNSFSKGKISRMGSFAFRASQFFESISKKTGRKLSSVSSMSNLRERSSTGSSLDSSSTPVSSSLGSPCVTTPETPVFLPEIPTVLNVKPITHQGYLCIYSNFNKRKWGKRWCLVRENGFECYRHEKSTVCELDFLLRFCKLRRAVAETKSELGLMLVEKAGEKITIEPLSREEMCGWLRVLMKETSTEKVPMGLEEFWVESPYHDINPKDLTSPTSESGGYSSIKDYFSSPETGTEDSTLDSSGNITLISDNQIPVSPEIHDVDGVCKVQGEITGDLYSQVTRKSSTESTSIIPVTNDNNVPDSVFTFDKEEFSHSEKTEDKTENNSMFADILNKINNHFNKNNSLTFVEVKQPDTAYSSAVCSENSSLERKPHQDVHSISENLDTLSQGTDIQVSPLEDIGPTIQANSELHNEGYENHSSAKIITGQLTDLILCHNQSTRTNFEFTNSVLDQSNISVEKNNQSEISGYESTNETHLTVESKSLSREQCDSAIFESESILEDLDGSPNGLMRKIEQLRTHLVELKKTRISVHNQKELLLREMERSHLDDEYNRLDEECRTITEEISFLEERLHMG